MEGITRTGWSNTPKVDETKKMKPGTIASGGDPDDDKAKEEGAKTSLERVVTAGPNGSQIVITMQITVSPDGTRSSKVVSRCKMAKTDTSGDLLGAIKNDQNPKDQSAEKTKQDPKNQLQTKIGAVQSQYEENSLAYAAQTGMLFTANT